ncbi:MAG: hypothetical protein ACI9RP_002640, partial [Cyclobacteriaceae bacterium]
CLGLSSTEVSDISPPMMTVKIAEKTMMYVLDCCTAQSSFFVSIYYVIIDQWSKDIHE